MRYIIILKKYFQGETMRSLTGARRRLHVVISIQHIPTWVFTKFYVQENATAREPCFNCYSRHG